MTAELPGRPEIARWKKTCIAVCAVAGALLAYFARSHGRADDAPRAVHVRAAPAGEHAFPELLEDDGVTARAPGRIGKRRLGEDSRPAPAPVYDDEMAHYLGTFLGESPDVLGWITCLGTLAASTELERESLSEEGGVLRGHFTVPGSDARGTFSIEDAGYTITVTNGATMRVLGIQSRASLSFEAVDGGIARAYGVVQFFRRDDEEGPVGYIFGTSDDKTLFRSIHQSPRNGGSRLAVTPPGTTRRLESGDLEPAYRWLELLQEVERSRSRGKS